MAKHTILFAAANPGDTHELALGDECAAVARELAMTPAGRTTFRFEARWAIDVDELMRHLLALRPSVLHFSCHGSRDSAIALHHDRDTTQSMFAPSLAQIIASTSGRIPLVLLSACHSAGMTEPLVTSADCVIGMMGPIADAAARSFSVAFYRALGHRCTIGNAFEQATAALAAKHLAAARVPAVRRDVATDGMQAMWLDELAVCITARGVDPHAMSLRNTSLGAAARRARPAVGPACSRIIDIVVTSVVDVEVLLDGAHLLQIDHATDRPTLRARCGITTTSRFTFRFPGFTIEQPACRLLGASDMLDIVIGCDERANVPLSDAQRRTAMAGAGDLTDLLGALRQPDLRAAAWAARRLGAIADRRALLPLLDIILTDDADHPTQWLQANAVKALADLGDPDAIASLEAALALVRSGPRRSYRYLLEATISQLRRVVGSYG